MKESCRDFQLLATEILKVFLKERPQKTNDPQLSFCHYMARPYMNATFQWVRNTYCDGVLPLEGGAKVRKIQSFYLFIYMVWQQ